MREPTRPQSHGTGPDDRRPPRHPADDLARLGGVLQQLRQMLEAHDTAPRWVPLEMTREAVALAHSLLHGWQVEEAMTQGWLTRWQQTLATAGDRRCGPPGPGRDPPGAAAPRAVVGLARGGGPHGPGGRVVGGAAPRDESAWQTLRPVPVMPERLQPSDERPSPVPDATLTSETHDTPIRDGP